MTLWFLVALFVKHFVMDFGYQPPYQFMNKGRYGHWGGLVHSGQHILATLSILWLFAISTSFWLPVLVSEFLIHYHTDWAKMNINRHFGWGAITHNEFWILTGFDQLIHSLTYLGIAAYVQASLY